MSVSKKPARSSAAAGYRGKREEAHARRKRRQMIERIIVGAVVAGLILAVAGVWYVSRRPAAIPGETQIPNEGAGHVPQDAPLTFEHYPPSSGNHYARTAEWGVYTTEIPEGNWLHNLEHGGIVILYNCPPEGCEDLQQQLAQVAKNIPEDGRFQEQKVVVTPYARELPSKIVLLAWTVQLNQDTVDPKTITDFYKRYVNRGPEVVP